MSETPMRLSQISVQLPPSLRSWVAAQELRRRRQDRSCCKSGICLPVPRWVYRSIYSLLLCVFIKCCAEWGA